MKWLIYFLVLLSIIGYVSAATIQGVIYDISLDKASNVVVEINTEPKQQYISKEGGYVFNVPTGNYAIRAERYSFGVLESSAIEKVSIKSEGEFVLDLILLPTIDSELADEAEDIQFEDDYFNGKPNYLLISIILLLVFVIFLLFYMFKKYTSLEKEEGQIESDEYLVSVLKIIKKSKRITQKDIRKQVPLSEAKISLIVSELEHKGIIEKIKKGRGNILVLKK